MTPNFENYTLSELHEAQSSLDRSAYPERASEIDRLIAMRQEELKRGGLVESGEQRKPGHRSFRVKRMTSRTVLLITFAGLVPGLAVLILLMGFFGVLGMDAIQFNGQYVYGWGAIKVASVLALIGAPLVGLFHFLVTYIGLRLFAIFSPLEIGVVVDDDATKS